jgi:hypothetical protein
LDPNLKTKEKQQIRVTIDIRKGSVSPAQQRAWDRFWAKIISDAKAGRI